MLRDRLCKLHPAWLALFATLAAFSTYTCMYAFRKPFTAATFSGAPQVLGIDYKSFIVIAQVLGYMLSKFIGIKVISELKASQRAFAILLLLGIAELALLGFGAVPAPWNAVFLLLNGLPLGMVWGAVFSYMEGRRYTEVMGLGLSASFVFASGIVKDAGLMLMGAGVSEYWMPAATGLLFALPALLSVYLLNQTPAPGAADVALRTQRAPMTGRARWLYFKRFAPGLILLIFAYVLTTAYRDFRDNFLRDIWLELSPGAAPPAFSATETPVALAVLAALMLLVLVKDNLMALMLNHLAVFAGLLCAGISTWAHQAGWIDHKAWIMLTGFGTYVAYVPFNSILFDRMIAAFRSVATVGFLIYVADAFGYLGSISVLLYKNFGNGPASWAGFFSAGSYVLSVAGGAAVLLAMGYFYRVYRRQFRKG